MKTRQFVLGILHRGDFHPYEIKRRLAAAMVDCYVDIDVGTLYYAVRQLEQEGLIEAVAQERVARGGVRTIYRITPSGRARFRDDLHRQLDEEGPVSRTLYGALLFLHLADPDIVIASIRRRIARLDTLIAKLGPIRGKLASVTSSGGEQLFRHLDRQRRLDRDWLGALLKDIEANGIRDVPDPAALGRPASADD